MTDSELVIAEHPKPLPAATVDALATEPTVPRPGLAMTLLESQQFLVIDARGNRAPRAVCLQAIDVIQQYASLWQDDLRKQPAEYEAACVRADDLSRQEQQALAAVAALCGGTAVITADVVLPNGQPLGRSDTYKRWDELKRLALEARARVTELSFLPQELQLHLGRLNGRLEDLRSTVRWWDAQQ